MLSATDAFPDMTPADQRHTQVVIGDHFSDIDEDEQEDEATSQSLDVGADDEAPPRVPMACRSPMVYVVIQIPA